MTTTSAAPVCVIGLGRMGTGMVQRLMHHGVPVTVWDRTPDRIGELVALGAASAATPAAAARDSALVLLSLADWSATRAVLYDAGGVLADGPLPGVLASTSTLAPDEVMTIASRTPAVLDVGLQGNHQHALRGELRLYVGGGADVLDRVRPLLELLGRQVRHVGELGAGMRLKLVINLLMGVEMQALAEAAALGARIGLDRGLVLDAIGAGGFASPVMKFKASRMASDDYAAPDFRLRLMAKDLQLALVAADQAGIELPVTQAAERTHEQALALGYGDLDCAAIARAVGGYPEPAVATADASAAALGGAGR
jgi:3-hydroxyisobutyrate dehydrogenase-like beta-hydroxyacid dehydrogenase